MIKKLQATFSIAFSFLLFAGVSNAQVYNTLKSGNWNDKSLVWSTENANRVACACSPDATISGRTVVNINHTIVSLNALAAITDSAFLFIVSTDTLVISRGTPFIKFSVSKNATILVDGTLIVNGQMDIADNTKIQVMGLGKIIVNGSLTYSGNAELRNDGFIDVSGTVTQLGNATVIGKSIRQEAK